MIDRKALVDKWTVRSAGTLACLTAACDVADKVETLLPPGWHMKYDVDCEMLSIANDAETKNEKSVDEFKLITRLVTSALDKKPFRPNIYGTEKEFTLSRMWAGITAHQEAGLWGSWSVYLTMQNPKDCVPNVKREKITTEKETLSLGDICLGFKEDGDEA